jgi:type IV fimbrial biogenesis protein FimT
MSSLPNRVVCHAQPGFSTFKSPLAGRGFTLIELVVTMALLAIVTAYSLPSLNNFITRQRQVSSINLLLSSLYLARSEAVMRSNDVMVCKSSNGNSCTTTGEWEQGWLLFEDRDSDRLLDSDEPIIASQQPMKEITIYYRAFGSKNYIVYTANGITNTNGTYTFCDPSGNATPRALIVYKTGRPRTSPTRSDGSPLTCPP